jgi:NAD(P)-dependent dehydrogenase (short-subunit alcohol dehydrogenase family)
MGQSAALVQADFTDPEITQNISEKIFMDNKVYGLINNASIFGDLLLEDTTLENWQDHFSVNVTTPFLLSKAFTNSLSTNEPGRIINMLDWRALRPGPDHFPYTISKAALVALTRSLAASVSPNITVNGIALGAVLPPIDGSDTQDITRDLPIPRWADMSEIEEAVHFLLTGAGYTTGEIIHIDGGRHLI